MAVQNSLYLTDGTTRTYPSTKHIATKQHCSVLVKRITTGLWEVVNVSDYSLVNNSIVFTTAVSSATFSDIEIRVADTQNELTTSPSDLAIVASNISSINTVSTNITPVQTVATNIASVQTVSGNNANINTVASNNASITTVANNIASVNTNTANIVDIQNASANAATATTQAGIATTQAGIATTQATNSAASAASSATSATNAANSATSAANSATAAAASAASFTGMSNSNPIMDGTASAGVATTASRSDHVHPSDTTKQDTLVSGTNIKTVGGTTLLGSGDIPITDSTKLPLAGGTMTGAITGLRETKVAMGANDINLASGNLFTKTISGATTLTVSNVLATGNANSFVLELTNGGSATITWFSGVKWASGTAPTLTAAGVDILGFYSHDGGTTWRGIVLAKDSK